MSWVLVKVGLKLMYNAWCCPGVCVDLMNAWLKLMIPLPLCPAPPPPSSLRQQWIEGLSISLPFNNSPVIIFLFCTIFHKTHYVPCL